MSATYLDRRRDLLVCAFDAAAGLGMSADTVHDGGRPLPAFLAARPWLAGEPALEPAGWHAHATSPGRGRTSHRVHLRLAQPERHNSCSPSLQACC